MNKIDNQNVELTVLTPTYNRCYLLNRCFRSLLSQTNKNFEWLIIDDGSSDETEKTVANIIAECESFPITFVKKRNGGKHTVLNYSHDYMNGKYLIILDDDDYLTPDAVETILQCWGDYDREDIWCLSFSKGRTTDKPLVRFDQDAVIDNAISFRINTQRDGDCAEVVKSEVFKQYQFPEFENETFIGEDCMWTTLAKQYNTVYFSKVIYICDYLEGGLTKAGRKFRLKNPKGGMYRSSIYLDSMFSLKVQIKHAILYDCFAIADGSIVTSIIKTNRKTLCFFMLPFGFVFYLKWSK